MREAQGKESRVYLLLDGVGTLFRDAALVELLRAEGLGQSPTLAGTYTGPKTA